MRILSILLFMLLNSTFAFGQAAPDTVREKNKAAEDPSQFFTRAEVFNEIQVFKNDVFLDVTTFRAVIKIGKRFTTRLEIPYVYNSNDVGDYKQSGLGDINFRLLGYRLLQTRQSVMSISMEASLNTAQSKLLGTGKNILIPMVTYSRMFPQKKMIGAIAVQQFNSVSGDPSRSNISFTKMQLILLKFWSKKTWTVLVPEWYIDYVKGGISMNLEGKYVYAPIPRFNVWMKAGAGCFGNFLARYQFSAELGIRRFFF